MARNVYGIDLGTYEIKVYDKKRNAIWKEKNAIALKDETRIFSVGDEAYEMYEKVPENIEIIFPMEEGVISHFDSMQFLLQNLLKKEQRFARGSEYLIAVPTDVTEVEKRAFYDLVVHSTAKARKINIVERGIADALGMGLDVQDTNGIVIMNFGGGTTEITVVAKGGLVLTKVLKMGGKHLDQLIATRIRHRFDFLIGNITAETLRHEFGFQRSDANPTKVVSGRDLLTGVPCQKEIPMELVQNAIKGALDEYVRVLKSMIERTPPEVLSGIKSNGIFITGGAARLKGMAAYIASHTEIHVRRAKDADINTVIGLEQVVSKPELKELSYSISDESYRWIR